MEYLASSKKVIDELENTLTNIEGDQANKFVDMVNDGSEIFVCGAGRSGFMARSFCMRLMHIGLNCYMVGETVTPNIKENDVLVVCSGSGETASLVSMAQKAKTLKAKVALVTINPESTIGKIADVVVEIKAVSPKTNKINSATSIQPMGSLFEQSLLIFLDISILGIMEKRKLTSDNMFKRHANLE